MMESAPSPFPTPGRAVYGFVLYLASFVAFVTYIVWAYIPDNWLHYLGLSYLPQKYWAIAIPCFLCVTFLLTFPAWFGCIFLCTPSLDSTCLIEDEFTSMTKKQPPGVATGISDLDISEVNRRLYLD